MIATPISNLQQCFSEKNYQQRKINLLVL